MPTQECDGYIWSKAIDSAAFTENLAEAYVALREGNELDSPLILKHTLKGKYKEAEYLRKMAEGCRTDSCRGSIENIAQAQQNTVKAVLNPDTK